MADFIGIAHIETEDVPGVACAFTFLPYGPGGIRGIAGDDKAQSDQECWCSGGSIASGSKFQSYALGAMVLLEREWIKGVSIVERGA